MANKEKIALLTRYQMRVLYYKCKEGATHEEIAKILGRDVNTIQYHMTRIYTLLEIKQAGKSREEMESELKNEIGPIIREMFPTPDAVKYWAPVIRNTPQEEKEEPEEPNEEILEPLLEEAPPPYIPPPSVQKLLGNPERQPVQPEILQSPPPGRRRINWWLFIGLIVVVLLMVIFVKIYPAASAKIAGPTNVPLQLSPTLVVPPNLTEVPANTSAPPTSPIITVQEMTYSKDGMVMVYIPEGEFQMGSSKAEDPQALDEELPRHIVYLDHYWIDKTEISNAQYAMCVAEGGCTKPANNYSQTRGSYYDDAQYADYPVIFVSWGQAAAYCAWAGRRLPTEAEWEKAARGPDGRIYPWGNSFDGTLANYCDASCQNSWKDNQFDDGYIDTSPAGDYPNGASMYGALDMAGNVYEWVADWFAPYRQRQQTNPTGADSGVEKIIRGGSWGDDVAHIRSAVRSHINRDNWMNFIGFRCAR